MPMTDAALAASKVKLVHIPTVLGAVVPIFNVPASRSSLQSRRARPTSTSPRSPPGTTRASPRTIRASICPIDRIIVVHRSDGSGTTFIWTDYLSKVSQDWAGGPGKGTAINWPTGVGGKGNEGVAAQVREFPGAIGYVELIYALQNHIDFGSIKNASGNWVKASIEGVTAAAATAQDSRRLSRLHHQRPGANSYPISSFTYLLIPTHPTDMAKEKVIKDMLSWCINSGESEVSIALLRAAA